MPVKDSLICLCRRFHFLESHGFQNQVKHIRYGRIVVIARVLPEPVIVIG